VSGESVGIDRRGAAWCVARVSEDKGRPDIRSLVRKSQSEYTELTDTGELRVIIAAPDRDVTVKSFLLAATDPGEASDRSGFELASSLLDDPALFDFEYRRTAIQDRVLGLAYRKDRLTELVPDNGVATFKMRAAALADGYAIFCRPEPGDLIGLADVSGGMMSLALVYKSQAAMLMHLSCATSDMNSEIDTSRLAIELKTIVNFKLSALADQGVSVPLGRLVLSGEESTEILEQSLKPLFPCGVARPQFNMGYLSGIDSGFESPSLENYLVALGLTV
jgi:hypothetical protein